jgi:hypothetical protein
VGRAASLRLGGIEASDEKRPPTESAQENYCGTAVVFRNFGLRKLCQPEKGTSQKSKGTTNLRYVSKGTSTRAPNGNNRRTRNARLVGGGHRINQRLPPTAQIDNFREKLSAFLTKTLPRYQAFQALNQIAESS